MQWHYAKQGRQFGPVDEDELRRLAQQGQIAPDDLVWNPTLGDKWVAAASVEKLFGAAPNRTPPYPAAGPQAAAAPRSPGGTHNRDLMRLARESLRGRWGLGVGMMVLYMLITVGVSFIPLVGSVASLLITGPMAVGLCLVFLTIARRSAADIGQMFHGFSRFGTALGAYLLMILFIVLWSLLLIIPGLIASYAYAMTFFVLADDPAAGPREAITRSKEMMRGNKWKLFCLFWRFFWWALLCVLTLGIGYLWLGPYMQTALAHFYEDVRPQS